MADILDHPLSSPKTWTSGTLLENDGLVTLDDNCVVELERTAAALRANPLPIEALRPDYFEMAACVAAMARVREQIEDGVGFAIVDRLPMDGMESGVATKLYWLLMSMIGRPVAQSWDGSMVYDVIDTGQKSLAGNGVRGSKTNNHQPYHNDNAFNRPPEFVGLLCLQTAQDGGVSGLISLETVYNILLADYPDALARLYEPFYFDRQMEHSPDDQRWSFKPVFEPDGDGVIANFSPNRNKHGYEMNNAPMDDATRAAIDAMVEVCEQPGLGKSFTFQPGQFQIVNNRKIAHRRTGFRDWPEPERRRHLVRMWLRDEGLPFYHG